MAINYPKKERNYLKNISRRRHKETGCIVLHVHYIAMQGAVLCSVREFGLPDADSNYEVLIWMRNYIIINNNLFIGRGTGWHFWLSHCATNRKVAGLIPDGVIGIFHWHNPSGCTMALGLTHPLIEMSTRNIFPGGKGGRFVGLTILLTTFLCRLSWNLGASTSWNPYFLKFINY